MKYAKEVIDLLGAFPGRAFKMAQIVRYVSPTANGLERHAIREGVALVIRALDEAGIVEVKKSDKAINAPSAYRWRECK